MPDTRGPAVPEPAQDRQGDVGEGAVPALLDVDPASRLSAEELLDVVGPSYESLKRVSARRRATPVVTSLADVESETVEWLWEGRIARGKLTVLDGDPGLGKSMLTLDLAARVTTGRPMPDGTPGPRGRVIMLSAEDGPADTIRPRLLAAEGDCDGVALLSGCLVDEDERPLAFPEGAEVLRECVLDSEAALVIIDPLMAYMGQGVDAHKDQDVRRALTSLARLAAETHAAIIVVRHLNKGSNGSALYRGAGSIGIAGAARSVLLVGENPNEPEHRVLAQIKNNLGSKAPSLGFCIEAHDAVGRIRWLERSPFTADELLASRGHRSGPTKTDDAATALEEWLSAGPRRKQELEELVERNGISLRTLERAKNQLGVRSHKKGFGKASCMLWSLPAHTRQSAYPSGGGEYEDRGEYAPISQDSAYAPARQPDGDAPESTLGLLTSANHSTSESSDAGPLIRVATL